MPVAFDFAIGREGPNSSRKFRRRSRARPSVKALPPQKSAALDGCGPLAPHIGLGPRFAAASFVTIDLGSALRVRVPGPLLVFIPNEDAIRCRHLFAHLSTVR